MVFRGILKQRSITAGYHLVEPVQSWNQWKLDIEFLGLERIVTCSSSKNLGKL